jgi:SAM-dependent methyltransferase
MSELSTLPFARPEVHARAADIVRRHSTRAGDVRAALLDGLELSAVRAALELGCGFGFASEVVLGRLPPGARLVGVDALASNRPLFLGRARAEGRQAEFMEMRLRDSLPWPDGAFGLVVSSFSLYFFPAIVPEVARVLAADGTFALVTHCRGSFEELFELAELPRAGSPLAAVLDAFPAEEAEARLSPWFAEVRRAPFPNRLRFEPADQEALLEYARFKLPLLARSVDGERMEVIAAGAQERFASAGRVEIGKDDAIFQCRGPRCP